jgi:hypothetical protein
MLRAVLRLKEAFHTYITKIQNVNYSINTIQSFENHTDCFYDRPGMREIREQILVDKGFTEDRECSGGGVFVFRAA